MQADVLLMLLLLLLLLLLSALECNGCTQTLHVMTLSPIVCVCVYLCLDRMKKMCTCICVQTDRQTDR